MVKRLTFYSVREWKKLKKNKINTEKEIESGNNNKTFQKRIKNIKAKNVGERR